MANEKMSLQVFKLFARLSWKDKAEKKVKSVNEEVPIEWRINDTVLHEAKQRRGVVGEFIEKMLDPQEKEITSWTALTIAAKIKERHCSAYEVTRAFCHRAAIAHQLVNCLHEIFFNAALDRARQLDAYQKQSNRVMGPLHGVPVSLKDQFYVKGVETTMGYVGWINTFEGEAKSPKYRAQESLVVRDLLALGAVLYCKTSLPQTLLLGETHNNIIGFTTNPWVQHLSCGGSSGGEGALLALQGSCVGIGTDIGGSVRIPAAFCGTYAIKPSHDRFSYKYMSNSLTLCLLYPLFSYHIDLLEDIQNPGQTMIKSSVGFMGPSLSSLKLMQTALLSQEPWLHDSEVVSIPWRDDQETVELNLCFGILHHDGYCRPHPPIERALRMVESALLKAGHKTLTWNPPAHRAGSHLHNEFMRCDGGSNIWQQLALSGEPIIRELKQMYGTGPKTPMALLDVQKLALQREDYRQRYNDYWSATTDSTPTGRPVDAVIMAVAPHAAVIPGKYFHYDYSDVVNVLDYTSVVIPVTTADAEIDIPDYDYQPANQTDRQNYKAYDAAAYDGAPVGLQIVARRLQEERCIALAQKVEEALHQVVDTNLP